MNMLKKTLFIISIFSCFGCAVTVEKSGPVPGDKIAVCHKGKNTIYVDEAAVNAHLNHGDYIGPCR